MERPTVFDPLCLETQLCFPLYAASREVIKKYHPFLSVLGLTYTQYVTMMVIWKERQISASALGKRLYLDSGTLTPVLKALESKGYIIRRRSTEDERVLMVDLTEKGSSLKEACSGIPAKVGSCIPLSEPDSAVLYTLLNRLLSVLNESSGQE